VTAQGSFKALLIGNGRFELDDRLKALTGPSHDVELLRSALTNPLLGLHGAEDVQCLIDAPCAAIVDATEQFFARADTDDQLLFYYSGHGWRGRFRRLHLCARDTRVDALLSSAMSDQVLNEAIRVSPSRRVVLVLDCCFSGLVGDFASKGPESGVEFIPPSLQGEGRFVMTSCQANEPAADGPEASPFTRFFCEALTSPETDTNGDGFVTVNEVYDYILPRMLKATKQTPERSISHAVANLPLGRSARREGVRGDGSEQASQQARGTPHNLKQRVLFVGRSQEVDDVERALAGTSRATITTRASIYGFGGVGKTAIAREVAWRAVDNSTYAGGVFWVEAEGQPLRAIPTLAAALKQADVANLDLDAPAEALASATTKALASTRSPILIVLDNVDQEGWDELIPGGAVRLVVTTRNAQLAIGAPHEVEALSGDAAVQFAIEFGGASASDEVEVMRRVVTDKLGGLPVAIEVAAKAVKSSVGSWRRYEKFLDTQGTDILQQVLGAPEFKSSNYPHGVFAALAGSVKNSSEVARRFLDAAIVFAPENVPVSWIVEAAGWERDSFEVSRAITELGNRSLVKWNKTEDAISMHRLVHACGREVAERKEWAATNRRGARCPRGTPGSGSGGGRGNVGRACGPSRHSPPQPRPLRRVPVVARNLPEPPRAKPRLRQQGPGAHPRKLGNSPERVRGCCGGPSSL